MQCQPPSIIHRTPSRRESSGVSLHPQAGHACSLGPLYVKSRRGHPSTGWDTVHIRTYLVSGGCVPSSGPEVQLTSGSCREPQAPGTGLGRFSVGFFACSVRVRVGMIGCRCETPRREPSWCGMAGTLGEQRALALVCMGAFMNHCPMARGIRMAWDEGHGALARLGIHGADMRCLCRTSM